MERSGAGILWVKDSGHRIQRPLSVSGTFHSFEASHHRIRRRARCVPGPDARFPLDPDLSSRFCLLPNIRPTDPWLIWQRWFDTTCGFALQQIIIGVPTVGAPDTNIVIRTF